MRTLDWKRVSTMLENIFIYDDVHAKRLESLTNYAIGAMEAPRAAVHAIGAAQAEVAEVKRDTT